MWHQSPDQPSRPGPAKSRYALLALAILAVMYVVVSWQADNAESNRDKRTCELVAGAGNCVESDGDWVRRGSSPLFGP